ncbi:MAG: acyltransferase 3 [Myxococcaceae bacterium]|nr:acyltransferase 3 [Myxococcaceae bacterium]
MAVLPTDRLTAAWRSLSRVTSSGRFIAEIDALRFFAIAGVVVHHVGVGVFESRQATTTTAAQSALLHALSYGAFGVPLFFAISGFILSLPFVEHHRLGGPRVSLGRYLLRRATRLEPPYLASLLLLFVLKVLARGESPRALLPHLAASAGYVHMLVYHAVSSISGVAWSLEVEVQFYLLVPLLAAVFRLRDDALRRGVIVATAAALVGFQHFAFERPGALCPHWMQSTILGHLQYFLVGFLLADVFALRWRSRPEVSAAGDPLWYGGWAALVLLFAVGGPVARIASPVVVFALYAGFFQSRAKAFFCRPFFTVTGGMCYSIYLVHNVVVLLATKLTARLPLGFAGALAAAFVVALPLVLLVSSVFFVLIERPCMDKNWPTKLWRALHTRAA